MGLRKKFAIRGGKVLLVDVPKKEKKTNHLNHLAISFNYNTTNMTPREIDKEDNKIRRAIIDNRICEGCGKRFEINQRICEGCGVSLSRM